jgi:hypothetical protein
MPCVVARIYIGGSLVVLERGVRVRKETCLNVQPLLGHPDSENYGELVSNIEEQLHIFLISTKVQKNLCFDKHFSFSII